MKYNQLKIIIVNIYIQNNLIRIKKKLTTHCKKYHKKSNNKKTISMIFNSNF